MELIDQWCSCRARKERTVAAAREAAPGSRPGAAASRVLPVGPRVLPPIPVPLKLLLPTPGVKVPVPVPVVAPPAVVVPAVPVPAPALQCNAIIVSIQHIIISRHYSV